MLSTILSTCEEGARARSRPLSLGLLACLCFGCPGVEPSATGSGAAGGGPGDGGADGGRPPTGAGGEDEGGGGDNTTAGSSAGGMNEGGCTAELSTDPNNCGECGRVCLHDDERVKTPRCVDSVCKSFCRSGFVNIETPESGPDDGCEAKGRRAFVTEEATPAIQLGGVDEADDQCQLLADTLELGGKWAAWLSEGTSASSPEQRFIRTPDAPYRLLDFTLVAASWEALVSGSLLQAIDLTENLMPFSKATAVWTGTTPLGLPTSAHCNGWSIADAEATVGQLVETAAWTQQEKPKSCGESAHLYCFEQ